MEVQYERCCGIDVHKKTVVACVIVPGARRGGVEKETQTYATMADDLGALGQWLQSKGVTHIAMESTGVYWMTLEDANLKLTSVVSDVTGVSARAMLDALLAGQTDPQVLATLAKGQL